MATVTTWTIDQIQAVRRMRTTITIATDAAASVNLRQMGLIQAAKRLSDAAHTYGVEIDFDDVLVVEEETDEEHMRLGIVVAWCPLTKAIELVGGEYDGRVMVVQNIHQPLTIAVMKPISLLDVEASKQLPPSPLYDEIVYRLSGWREQERRWVFTPATTTRRTPPPA